MTKALKVSALILVLLALFPHAADAKKKKAGLKKIVAVGYVDTGYLGFENLKPQELSEMFRIELKKELEKKGFAPVLAQLGKPVKKQVTTQPSNLENLSNSNRPPSAAEMRAVMAQMQEVMGQMHGYSRPAHKPVAAQGLFHFRVRTGESSVDTAETVGWAEYFSQRSLDVADVSSDTTKIHILVTQHDPESGALIEKNAVKASSTRFNRVVGTRYYTLSDSADNQAAFNRVFSSAIKKSADWIDKRMKKLAWEGQVFKTQGKSVYINAGSEAGITPGMHLKVIDRKAVQARGVDLGQEDVPSGEIEISTVQAKFAVASITSGTARVGAIVKAEE